MAGLVRAASGSDRARGTGDPGGDLGAFAAAAAEFLPDDDKGYVLVLLFAPEGATSEFTDRCVRQAEQIASEFPELQGMFSAVALARGAPGESDFGIMFLGMKPGPRRSVLEIARPGAPGSLFTRLLTEIKGAQAISVLPKASGTLTEQFALVLQGSDLGRLETVANTVRAALADTGFLAQPRLNFNFEQPQLSLEIDRDVAASVGVSVRDASLALQLLWGGLDVARYNERGKEYKVIAQLDRDHRLTPDSLQNIHLRAANGQLVRLDSLLVTRQQGSPQRDQPLCPAARGHRLGPAPGRHCR